MMSTAEKKRIQQAFEQTMDYDELMNCTRCGFCLPTCPTYIQSGFDEVQSPRGRIALMKAVVDGYVEPTEEIKRSIDLCLGCRACETVCPSGVKFGRLLEQARDAIYQANKQGIIEKSTRNLVFNQLFPKQNRVVQATSLLGFYQRSGLQTTARKLGMLKFLPEPLRKMEKVLPEVHRKRDLKNRQRHYEPLKERKKKVAFFGGCLMDTMFRSMNDATTKLLQYAGCEIVVPQGQGCCGALQGHSGELDKAREMAKKNIAAFEAADVDYIITNAGGCGGFLVDHGYLLKDDPEWAERAKAFSEKIKDITEVLIELGFHEEDLVVDEQIVTYQDSCHLRNGQGVIKQPRQLLEAIEGVHFVDMDGADQCCGSAGVYNIIESEMSMKILDDKMEKVKDTHAKTIVTTNPGCYLQMKLGVEREGLSDEMRVVHIVELLIEAYENAKKRVHS